MKMNGRHEAPKLIVFFSFSSSSSSSSSSAAAWSFQQRKLSVAPAELKNNEKKLIFQ